MGTMPDERADLFPDDQGSPFIEEAPSEDEQAAEGEPQLTADAVNPESVREAEEVEQAEEEREKIAVLELVEGAVPEDADQSEPIKVSVGGVDAEFESASAQIEADLPTAKVLDGSEIIRIADIREAE